MLVLFFNNDDFCNLSLVLLFKFSVLAKELFTIMTFTKPWISIRVNEIKNYRG